MNLRSRVGLDWRLVRGLAQLHVLNRTSLMLIIAVPILAAIWPVVQHTLMWYDGLLGGIQTSLENVIEDLAATGQDGGNTGEMGRLRHGLQVELRDLHTRLQELRLRSSGRLPVVWGLLFFSSLAVLCSTTIFQLACPDIVREFRLDDFSREKKREYSESPSASAVAWAIRHLESRSLGLEIIDEERTTEARANQEVDELRQRLREAESDQAALEAERERAADKYEWDNLEGNRLRSIEDTVRAARDDLRRFAERDRGDRGPDFRRKMALIETAATSYYLEEAGRTWPAMTICAIGYAFALWMLGDVFLQQAKAVASAVGWGI
jgi:hypothetical protein